MKRSFLKELGLESEVIDKIMAENGKDIEKYKTDIEDYVSEIKELKSNNVDTSKAIEEAVKAKEKEYKATIEKTSNYDDIVTELEGLKKINSEKESIQNIEKFFEENKIDFTSSFAKEAIITKFKEKEFKLNDNKFGEDAVEFINELKESSKDAFKITETNNNVYTYQPKGSNLNSNDDLAAQVNSILGI